MLDVGGQDSTEAFEDVGHSDEAREILDGLLAGTLKRQVSISPHHTHTYTLTHLAILEPRTQYTRKLPSDRPPCHPPATAHKPTKHLTHNLAPLHPCQTPPYPAPRIPGPRNHSAPIPTPAHTYIHTYPNLTPNHPHNPIPTTEKDSKLTTRYRRATPSPRATHSPAPPPRLPTAPRQASACTPSS